MIYLDNAATTALDPAVLEKMMPYFSGEFGNASSVHSLGRDARMAVERARQQVAGAIGAQAKDVIFTSSATEANNLAIKGVIEGIRRKFGHEFLPEIIASPIEHPCVMEALRHVESLGWAKIVWLPVDEFGMVSIDTIKSFLTNNTVLISVMFANNEIGTVQPVAEIGAFVRRARLLRFKNADGKTMIPLYFHCDAVQAIQYFDCDVNAIGIDLLSITGHKIYGPKGSGVLYARDGMPLTRQIDGGGQEYYKRAGTENVAGIVGIGEALNNPRQKEEASLRLKILQKELSNDILESNTKVHLTGHAELRAPHITSFLFENVDGEALITALDREGVAVSSGSACSSGVVRQSHVIEALSLTGFDVRKSAALRVSTSKHSTSEDIQKLIALLSPIVSKLRELAL
ncbi:MAG: cysteine desulfurase [bacterium]|nr:cysteine desulfurase [bacterium]